MAIEASARPGASKMLFDEFLSLDPTPGTAGISSGKVVGLSEPQTPTFIFEAAKRGRDIQRELNDLCERNVSNSLALLMNCIAGLFGPEKGGEKLSNFEKFERMVRAVFL